MCNRHCIFSDETSICVSEHGETFAAGHAFTLQPHNPALYELRAEESVYATAAVQPLNLVAQEPEEKLTKFTINCNHFDM